MTDTQIKLLSLFKEIVDICDRHNIEYYMAGGSLIGVLRHGGFIPWDDDLDISMTRDNWKKFLAACREDIPEGRFLDCQENDRNYPNNLARYVDLTSTAIHLNQLTGGSKAGYVVDVFILDPIPSQEAYEQYLEDLMLYSDLTNTTSSYSSRLGINQDRYFEALERIKTEGREKVLSELEQKMSQYDEKDCDYLALHWGGFPFLFKKSMYGNSRWGYFEGVKCRIPDRSWDYLVQHYGDEWEYIPPHAERESHNAIYNIDTDYVTIQNDYLAFIDKEKVKNAFLEKKAYMFHASEALRENQDMQRIAQAECVSLEMEKKLESASESPEEMLKERKYDELSDFFSYYYEMQGSRIMIGRQTFPGIRYYLNPKYIEIDDDVFNVALMTLVNTNRLGTAMRFIEVKEHVKGPASGRLRVVKDLILRSRRIFSLFDTGEVDEAVKEAECLHEDDPDMFTMYLFLSKALIRQKRYTDAKVLIDEAIEKYPDEGYFLKYLGDYYREYVGDVNKAYELYGKAELSTYHGTALKEIQDLKSGKVLEGSDQNQYQ